MAVTDFADTSTTDHVPPTAERPGGARRLAEGDKVEVRRRLDDKWARGFAVVAAGDDGYRLRRLSDGVELPTTFPATDVRKERKRDFWWY